MPRDMHRYTDRTEGLADKIIDHARWRTRLDPIPLGEARTAEELAELCGETITEDGIGGSEALRLFADVLEPNCLSVDYPRYLSFVPAAPTEAAVLFDLVVGSASIYGGSWLEGSGAAFAENEALDWFSRRLWRRVMPWSIGRAVDPTGGRSWWQKPLTPRLRRRRPSWTLTSSRFRWTTISE